MSSTSYANVVATGSTSTEETTQPVIAKTDQVERTPEPIDVDSKTTGEGEEDSKTQTQLPSPNPSPKAEQKQKEQNLAPAPVPSVSAWGSAASSRSNSNVSSVDTRHWPSPHELETQPQVNGSSPSKKINAVKSSKEKWVPFKASVVLPQPGSKKSNNHGQKRNSNKNSNVLSNNNKQLHNDAKKRKNKTEKRPNGVSSSSAPAEAKEAPKADFAADVQVKAEQNEVQSSASKTEASAPEKSSSHSHNNHQNSNHAQSSSTHHSNNNHHNNNNNNHHHSNTLRYHNNQFQQQQHHQQFIPFQPFPVPGAGAFPSAQNGSRPFRPYSNSNRRFNKYQSNNNGYNNQFRQHNSNFNAPFNRRNVAHLNKSSEPLFSLIKQIEYYFSIENLLKDIFLRKQMNSEGWLNLTVISGFYRMSVLSAGDINLVRRAIDELNGELLELAEFSNNTLKVRVRENFSNWVLPVDQRDANGQDESDPVEVIQPGVNDAAASGDETREQDQEEKAEQQEFTQDATTAAASLAQEEVATN